MSIYLSASLGANRKGRFLQSVAGAEPLTDDWRSVPPSSGLLLLQCEELVGDVAAWQALYQWAVKSGCVALVINPQADQLGALQQLPTPLDWQLAPVTPDSQGEGLTALLADEIDHVIVGFSGSADRHQHQIGDTTHSRYVRKHSNSGLFAITTLPLWSLSLLDHSEALIAWLEWFVDHAGVAEQSPEPETLQSDYVPDKQDIVVLLLLYAGQGLTLQELIEHEAVKLMFDTARLDISARGEILSQHGFIQHEDLTEKGRACVEVSPFFGYASLLSEQLSMGV